LLLVKEKDGGVLGAYLDADLERRPSWYGSSLNFVFSAGPAGLGVFRATGFNDHYQYFNYGTKTLPNGLGVGGQMGNFGLWVDVDFMSGQSCTSATYAAPQLAERSEFEIEHVEAWVVRRSKREDKGRQRSAMDANPDAVAILEMANRTMYSKMVREP
ncbi:TLD-domain-containing protein, partial [Linderina pennispora]